MKVVKQQESYDICCEVFRERLKQVNKGYDAAHNDNHNRELLDAAVYFIFGTPWPCYQISDTRSKHSRREQLIIAMALICAEIERLDRCKQQT